MIRPIKDILPQQPGYKKEKEKEFKKCNFLDLPEKKASDTVKETSRYLPHLLMQKVENEINPPVADAEHREPWGKSTMSFNPESRFDTKRLL